MIDVLILTFKDLSNVAWRTGECLKLLGLNVMVYKGKGHMEYPGQCNIAKMKITSIPLFTYECKDKNVKQLAKQAKVLHFSSGTYVDTGIDIKNKTAVFQYGGRPFIGNPSKIKNHINFINKFVNYTVVHHPSFLKQGANNAVFIKPPIDTNIINPDFNKSHPKKLIIGHFPSNKIVKGTGVINSVIDGLMNGKYKNKVDYIVDTKRLPWNAHLERLKKCDVVIECITPTFKNSEFGEWSSAALESAALGKVTVTNSLHENIYEKHFGKSQLVVANNKLQLKKNLIRLIKLSDEELLDKKILTREWVVNTHSLEATARAYWEKVYKYIFPHMNIEKGENDD